MKIHLYFKVQLDKKLKYALISLFAVLGVFYISFFITSGQVLFYFILVTVLSLLAGIFITQYSFLTILPAHLILGFLASLYYFPNLGVPIKIVFFIALGALIYAILLVNNIFMVMEEKGSIIPLYTVAITWIQILVIVVSIPFFSSVYKIPAGFLMQNTFIFLSSFLFCLYMVWAISFDTDVKKTDFKEKLTLTGLFAFLIFIFGSAVSFFPTESFLRALFVSSILFFSLSYIYAHYKNRVSKRLIFDYSIISIIFFFILVVYKP